MDFTGMTPEEAAKAIADQCAGGFLDNIRAPMVRALENQITTMGQHFSNEALERARRWNHQAAVKEFMVKFEQYRQDTPGWPPQEVLDLRIRLIAEEFTELVQAAGYECYLSIERVDSQLAVDVFEALPNQRKNPDFAAFVDAHADLEYVLNGTLESCGVQGQPVWDEVHAANMRKEGGATRSDGKICKPEGWVGPDVERVLREQGWEG